MADREKIIKLMNLATSSNDAEALSALRMANNLLKKENMLWDKFLNGSGGSSSSYYQESSQERNLRHRCRELEGALATAQHGRKNALTRNNQLEIEIKGLKKKLSEAQNSQTHQNSSHQNTSNEKEKSGNSGSSNPFGDSPFNNNQRFNDASVREMLDVCLERVSGTGIEFIQSLDQSFKKWGSLTYRQHEALKKFYWNCQR